DKWPWQVSVEDNSGNQFCGATVISENWVLTAAHCVFDENSTELIDVKNVMITTGKGGNNAREFDVAEIIPHAEYKTAFDGKDIALLKLGKPLTFDDSASPICLPHPAQLIPNDGNAVVIGYGISNERGTDILNNDNILSETIIPIVNDNVCGRRWIEYAKSTPTE
ncbi:hypothetical protein PMAYCL1PPCAC_27748, partial [Pristionchus mayeri]